MRRACNYNESSTPRLVGIFNSVDKIYQNLTDPMKSLKQSVNGDILHKEYEFWLIRKGTSMNDKTLDYYNRNADTFSLALEQWSGGIMD